MPSCEINRARSCYLSIGSWSSALEFFIRMMKWRLDSQWWLEREAVAKTGLCRYAMLASIVFVEMSRQACFCETFHLSIAIILFIEHCEIGGLWIISTCHCTRLQHSSTRSWHGMGGALLLSSASEFGTCLFCSELSTNFLLYLCFTFHKHQGRVIRT